MWRYMLSQSAYQIAVLFFLLYGLPSVMPGRYGTAVDPEHKRSLSLLFNSFIFMQVRGSTHVAVGTAHRYGKSRALLYNLHLKSTGGAVHVHAAQLWRTRAHRHDKHTGTL